MAYMGYKGGYNKPFSIHHIHAVYTNAITFLTLSYSSTIDSHCPSCLIESIELAELKNASIGNRNVNRHFIDVWLYYVSI